MGSIQCANDSKYSQPFRLCRVIARLRSFVSFGAQLCYDQLIYVILLKEPVKLPSLPVVSIVRHPSPKTEIMWPYKTVPERPLYTISNRHNALSLTAHTSRGKFIVSLGDKTKLDQWAYLVCPGVFKACGWLDGLSYDSAEVS